VSVVFFGYLAESFLSGCPEMKLGLNDALSIKNLGVVGSGR